MIKGDMFVCLSVCLLPMAGRTAGPIKTKLGIGTHVDPSDILGKELILNFVSVRFSFINYSFYSNSVLTVFLVLVFIQFYSNNFSFSSYLVLM